MSAQCAPDGSAPALSPEEYDAVVWFGLDRPASDEPEVVEELEVVDDVEGMTFGMRLVVWAAVLASMAGMAVLLVAFGLSLLRSSR